MYISYTVLLDKRIFARLGTFIYSLHIIIIQKHKYAYQEADTNIARAAHKPSFLLLDRESKSKLREWLIIEQAAATSESLGVRTED